MELQLAHFTIWTWVLAAVAAWFIGVAKGGIGGVAMLSMVIFASILPAKLSVGVVLPLLIAGDLLAVAFFRQHAHLAHVWKLLPASLVGVGIGWWLLRAIPDAGFAPVIGGVILALIGVQLWRNRPGVAGADELARAPLWFSVSMGILAGITTMLANAAGAVMAIYLLSMRLEKQEFVGTAAVFFFFINLLKTPFSAELGILNPQTLLLNALLAPAVWAGFFCGRWVLKRMSQKVFEAWMLGATALAAVALIFK